MDSHRNYAPDEHDGHGRQPERGYPNPEWDRAGDDPRYAPVSPAPVTYGQQRPAYPEPNQQHDNPAYGDFQARGGYPREADSPFPPIGDAGGRDRGDGAGSAVLAMPVGPRSGQQLPPLPPREPAASVTAPMPPGFAPAREQQPGAAQAAQHQAQGPGTPPPGYAPVSAPHSAPVAPHSAPAAMHTTPTSGVPHLAAEDLPQPGGWHPQAGDPRPVSGEPRPVSGNPHPASGSPYPVSGGPGLGGPAEETQFVHHSTEAIDRSELRRPAAGPGQTGDGVYRSRRPGTAAVLVVITVLFELMALRLLASAFLTSKPQVGGSIASFFLMLGLPMFSVGLYGLLSGVAAGPGDPTRAWLRQPLVYLPVALALFVVAGLAAA